MRAAFTLAPPWSQSQGCTVFEVEGNVEQAVWGHQVIISRSVDDRGKQRTRSLPESRWDQPELEPFQSFWFPDCQLSFFHESQPSFWFQLFFGHSF